MKYLSTVEDKELIPYEIWITWLEEQGDIVKNNMLLPFKEYDNLMDSINKKKKRRL